MENSIKYLKKHLHKTICKNHINGEEIKLLNVISEDSNTIVYKGNYIGKEVIVKICVDKDTSSIRENQYYDYLEQYSINLPKHYKHFQINNYPVLVLDKMSDIRGDNGIQIGNDILKQMYILHKNGMIWGSCKPNNIMKNGTSYTMIDLGSISLVKEGACRKSFSSGYRTQEDDQRCKVIYPWNDLYELGKTVVALEMKRKGKDFSRGELDKYGHLELYFHYLKKHVSKHEFILPDQIYQDLENLMKKY